MRWLSGLAGRPTACLMAAAGLSLLGINALARLSPGLLPRTEHPGITIITRWHGIGAERIERDITIPVERSISDIPGIELLEAESKEGESRVSAVFGHHANVSARMLDASERLRQVRHDFPGDVEEPYAIRYDPDDRPVFVVTFSDGGSLGRTRSLVESRLKPLFERIDGVSEVVVSGGFERELQVVPLAVRGGPGPSLLHGALASGNVNLGAGRKRTSGRSAILFHGRLSSPAELADVRLPIEKTRGGTMRDFATIQDHHRLPTSLARTNGEERVSLFVQKAGDANALAVSRGCRLALSSARFLGLQPLVSYDQGLFIEEAVGRLASSAVYGILAATCILFLFLGRPFITLVTAACIPVSILATFFCMYVFQVELNTMSLSGIALGTGMLIDNAVVMLDAVEREFRVSGNASAAATGAVQSTAPELVAATLTTMIVFLPLAFVAADTRALFADLALTVTLSLGVSLAFAIAVLPAFLGVVFRREARASAVPSAGGPSAGLVLRLQGFASRISRAMVKRSRSTITTGMTFALLLPLFYMLTVKGEGGLSGERALSARVDLPTDTRLEDTARLVAPVENLLRKHPAVEEISVRLEKAQATISAKLRPGAPDAVILVPRLQALANTNPDVFVYFRNGSQGPEPELELILLGEDQMELQNFARESAGRIRAELPGVNQVLLRFREPGRDVLLIPQRARLLAAGLSLDGLGQTLRYSLSGVVATKWYDGEREIDVRLTGRPGEPPLRSELNDFVVPTAEGHMMLRDLVLLKEGGGPRRLARRNKRPAVSLTLRFSGSEEAVADRLRTLLSRMAFPENTTYAFGEDFELRGRSRRELLLGVVAALCLVYFVLAALFESLLRPLFILLTAPVAIAVVLGAFALLRIPLQMNVYLGLILLCGTVVNNSILIVSNVPRGGPKTTRRIIAAVIQQRVRAILMTTLTTLMGLAPMLLDFGPGAELFRPLALTVGLGLLVGIPVSLGFVPCLLHTFEGRDAAAGPVPLHPPVHDKAKRRGQ